MTLYVFTIEFYDEDNLDYKIIKGIFDYRGTAEEEALKSLNTQKALWPDSEVVTINSDKTALKTPSGYSKVYSVKEMKLNKIY